MSDNKVYLAALIRNYKKVVERCQDLNRKMQLERELYNLKLSYQRLY